MDGNAAGVTDTNVLPPGIQGSKIEAEQVSHPHVPDHLTCPQSFPAALIATLPAALLLATLFGAACHITSVDWDLWIEQNFRTPLGLSSNLSLDIIAVFAGFIILSLVWICLALCYYWLGFTAPDRASGGSYGALVSSLRGACAALAELRNNPAIAQPSQQRQSVVERIALQQASTGANSILASLQRGGPQWVLGTGYIILWDQMSVLEEALIQIAPRDEVLAGAWYDQLRCARSNIQDRESLCAMTHSAIQYLRNLQDPERASHTARADGSDAHDQQQPTKNFRDAEDSLLLPSSEPEARYILRKLRHAINQFRHERWAGLVRARNMLRVATTITGITLYWLLWFTIIADGPPGQLANAMFYFFIGAAVGLFGATYAESRTQHVVDDYGFSIDRLLTIPLISGVAALAGVVLFGLLNGGAMGPQHVGQFFDPPIKSLSALAAATFGLTPGLLLDQLQGEANKYKTDLKSTRVAEASQNRS
jgi:hypothetical protein